MKPQILVPVLRYKPKGGGKIKKVQFRGAAIFASKGLKLAFFKRIFLERNGSGHGRRRLEKTIKSL